jgi:hypothetical protein
VVRLHPLTGPEFSPGAGIDFWLFGVTLLEISGIIGALELVVLILRFRAPGMSLRRIPLFSWSALVMASMILFAFPFVIAASSLLEIERKLGAPFYDPGGGGDPLLWQHLFWIFGHPEVYIMLIPAAGIISAVVAAHVKRPIVAYPLVVAALVGIAVASFGLWVHHMFTVGLPVLVLSLFAIASFFIAVPSGIQVFAWIATVWEGRPVWRTPLWFAAGFLFIFVLGGITGVMVATAPFDTQAHDSFFVVAHFHYVLIGGVVFPLFAGLHHWFPKFTGRLPSETAGKVAFWLMFVGFNVTFFPQHWLGLQGMVRRTYTYPGGFGVGGGQPRLDHRRLRDGGRLRSVSRQPHPHRPAGAARRSEPLGRRESRVGGRLSAQQPQLRRRAPGGFAQPAVGRRRARVRCRHRRGARGRRPPLARAKGTGDDECGRGRAGGNRGDPRQLRLATRHRLRHRGRSGGGAGRQCVCSPVPVRPR